MSDGSRVEPVPGLVTLHRWRVPARRVSAAAARVAVDRHRRTAQQRWYAEDRFARFAVLGGASTLDGRDPLR